MAGERRDDSAAHRRDRVHLNALRNTRRSPGGLSSRGYGAKAVRRLQSGGSHSAPDVAGSLEALQDISPLQAVVAPVQDLKANLVKDGELGGEALVRDGHSAAPRAPGGAAGRCRSMRALGPCRGRGSWLLTWGHVPPSIFFERGRQGPAPRPALGGLALNTPQLRERLLHLRLGRAHLQRLADSKVLLVGGAVVFYDR